MTFSAPFGPSADRVRQSSPWWTSAPGSAANGAWLAALFALYFVAFTVYVAPYLALLEQMDREGLARLVVAHVSENNNCRHKTEEALLSVLESLDAVVWADQAEGFDWLVLP